MSMKKCGVLGGGGGGGDGRWRVSECGLDGVSSEASPQRSFAGRVGTAKPDCSRYVFLPMGFLICNWLEQVSQTLTPMLDLFK